MRSVLCSVCMLLLVGAALAQGDRGTLTGTITDASGAVIAGAIVEARNVATGAVYPTTSTATGNYTLSQLPVGVYHLSVRMSGFKGFVRENVEVRVAQIFRVDAALEVGAPSETVTVVSEAPMLKTESGELSHNITTDRIDNLPILTLEGAGGGGPGNIRNPLQSTVLLPGAQFATDNTLRINGMPSSSQAIPCK